MTGCCSDQAYVHKSVMEELKRIIDDSEITKEDDALWPPPDRVGRQVSLWGRLGRVVGSRCKTLLQICCLIQPGGNSTCNWCCSHFRCVFTEGKTSNPLPLITLQELEIVIGDEHISFTTSKIGSLIDVNQSK